MQTLPVILVLAVAFAAPSAGARVQPAGESADLVIVGSSFGRVVGKTVIDPYGPVQKDRFGRPRARMRGAPPPIVILQREAYVLVRNVGNRRVESIEWSVVFYADAKHEQVVERHAFRSKEKILPGEMKFISESVKEDAPTAFETVSIDRIVFADGTSTAP
jgi:hypothetical protein